MRILGVDYGEKKIGLAVSDEGGTLAFPFGLLEGKAAMQPQVFKELKEVCRNENIQLIVVGLPLRLAGEEMDISRKVRDFAGGLEKATGLAVILEKEFLTSKLAEKKMKEAGVKNIKEKLDAAAAAEILQSYLDREKTKSGKN